MTVSVRQQPSLAHVDLRRAELVQPPERRIVVNRRIAQRDGENKTVGGQLGRMKTMVFHLLKHARNAFADFAQVTEIGQHPDHERIARKMNSLLMSQLFERYRRGR